MRNYPKNSPQAAARLVALTLISDGVASPREFEALAQTTAAQRLGLSDAELLEVLRTLCEDLMQPHAGSWNGRLSEDLLLSLLDEVQDPTLRQQVLALCVAVAEADAHLADSEGHLLALAAQRWGACPAILLPGAPLARSRAVRATSP
ncbi:TerB family tellurite resistance protein [Inhella proteolytica]|uniref:TerB family tellurite resistance protein n=1 Tax=Inhella proteolytica TaxID=2795029 RepID=A0A931J117_9BURK|nr:TerB family tellurite resistance protein [Inhella proteolytica]MBH9575564.1 TerB family tellurite resistance protein [Inhella proteolytica]